MTESEPTSGKNPKPVKRLYRSGQQKVVAGVCGGLAEYFQVDVAIMRIIWILFTLAGGSGIIAYLLFWLIVPPSPEAPLTGTAASAGRGFGTLLLIIAGLIILGVTPPVWCAPLVSLGVISLALPGLIFAVGVGLLIGYLLTRDRASSTTSAPASRQRLYRSRNYRILSGVCGGLAQHFNLDPVIMRILWVLFALGSLGAAAVLYLVLALILPEEP